MTGIGSAGVVDPHRQEERGRGENARRGRATAHDSRPAIHGEASLSRRAAAIDKFERVMRMYRDDMLGAATAPALADTEPEPRPKARSPRRAQPR
jgi:hypothetical protein